jgi:phytoene dehydrogenase-like protein
VSSSYYDVVVLGTDLAPLTCAALLAKRGFRVAVLGQQTERADYAVGPYRLPRQPFSFTASHSPLARRIFGELGLSQSLRRLSTPLEPAFQVALRGHRFDMLADEAGLEAEIEREFPEVKRPILDFRRRTQERARITDQLLEPDIAWPPESLLDRRAIARLAARLDLERGGAGMGLLSELADAHPFRAAVLGSIAFDAHLDLDSVSELQLTRLWSGRLREPAVLAGGLAALSDLLADKIRSHSGQLLLRERASQINLRRSGVQGVRLFGSDQEIGAAVVIAGVDVASVQRLLADRSPFEQMFERLGEPQPRFYRYTLNAVVDARGVPEGMKRDVFYVRDSDKPLCSDNLLHVELSRLDERESLLCVEALLPSRTVEDRDGSLDDVRERLMHSLGDLVPFVRNHLKLLDSPHDGQKPWARDAGSPHGTVPLERRGPQTMPVVHAFPVTTALSVCAMPVKTPIRGLLLCNQQVAPGLGLEGELVAAVSAAKIVRGSDRSREWLRRRLWTKVEI